MDWDSGRGVAPSRVRPNLLKRSCQARVVAVKEFPRSIGGEDAAVRGAVLRAGRQYRFITCTRAILEGNDEAGSRDIGKIGLGAANAN